MTRIDLHAHTEHSDGTLTPTALVRLARDVGLATLAVTDHDTTSSFAEAEAEGRAIGVEVIVGCEISTRAHEGNVHILGYAFDPADLAFQSFLGRVREARERRNERMIARLASLGVPVTHEEVASYVKGRIMARPHLGRALVARGYVPDLRAAFSQYLRDDGPAYVSAAFPPPEEAIAAIVAAGGVAVLAHPGQIRMTSRADYSRLLARLKAMGLGGIEVQHPSHDVEKRALFTSLAAEHDLVASGGSDFHGENKPRIRLGSGDGNVDISGEVWERLRSRRRPPTS